MILVRLIPKNSTQSYRANGAKTLEPVFEVASSQVKVMTMLKATAKVKSEARKLVLLANQMSKQGKRISSLIRIQIEETKRKVRALSPSARQFIGPGD